MKIIALYLPQYHRIEENDRWWGDGYTEWTAVKNAKPLFSGHYEPHVPLHKNYYDLSDKSGSVWEWQTNLAKRYGIDAFCIYHYWFGQKRQLLQKPAEILLLHKEIDFPFCFCWANESWRRVWYGLDSQTLMEQRYGGIDEIKDHFDYLLPFFKDPRYFTINHKPVFLIYKTLDIQQLDCLVEVWNKEARKNGLEGIYFVAGNTDGRFDSRPFFDAYYDFQPGISRNPAKFSIEWDLKAARRLGADIHNKIFPDNPTLENKIPIAGVYRRIIKRAKYYATNSLKPVFPCLFPCWDNSPRRLYKGYSFTGSSPAVFQKALHDLKPFISNDQCLIINAWNEWGEGCHLEPDEKFEYGYLDALKKEKDLP
jgi:hypothetical protein